jgi:hypothetical protein
MLLTLAACGRGEQRPDAALDDALRNDLALASVAQPYPAQQFVSPVEQGYAPSAVRRTSTAASQSTVRRAPTPVRRTSTSSSRTSTAGTSYPAPAAEPIRHTKRDAMIGAATGAVIGATTSRNKVKGAVIGAAIGGLAGAVVGHTIDVERP